MSFLLLAFSGSMLDEHNDKEKCAFNTCISDVHQYMYEYMQKIVRIQLIMSPTNYEPN